MNVSFPSKPLVLSVAPGVLSSLVALTLTTLTLLTYETDKVSAQQRDTSMDITLHSDNSAPREIWSDGTTMWVADFSDRKLYAYSLDSGTRQDTKDIDLTGANVKPFGLWSDGTTIWALNTRDDRIYAYTLSSGSRDEGKDIRLHRDNDIPAGIWSNNTTMWVVDQNDKKLYAYALDGGARQNDKDVTLSIDRPRPLGIWSDGSTIWIAYDHHQDYLSDDDYRLHAFSFEDGTRASDSDVAISIDPNSRSTGIWSNGTTVWVSDKFHDKLIAYDLPEQLDSSDATLNALSLNVSALSPMFSASTTSYTASVGYGVVETTVNATTSDDRAKVKFLDRHDNDLADADSSEVGHQVSLEVGENVVKVKVTAADETTEQTYTLTITRHKAEVSIRSDTAELVEGSESVFTVVRNQAVSEQLDVTVSVSESGTLVADSEEGVRNLTIPSGATSTSLTVSTDDDDGVWEAHSTITATIANSDAYLIVSDAGSASVQVKDNDFPAATATLSVEPNPVAEGGTLTATVAVTTNADEEPHGGGGVLTLSASEGTAQAEDYGRFGQTSLHIDPGDFTTVAVDGATRHGAKYTAAIVITDDNHAEGDEAFAITIAKTNAPHITLPTSATTSVTISANDSSTDPTLSALSVSAGTLAPDFSSTTTSYTASVGYAEEQVTVTATKNSGNAQVEFLDGSDNAIPDADENTDGHQVALDVGENVIKVKVTAEDDIEIETYILTVTRAKPQVSVSAATTEAVEGDNLAFTISRDASVSEKLDLEVRVDETGALITDIEEGDRTVSIPPEAKSSILTVTTDFNDDTWEDHSTVYATIKNSDAYTIEPGKTRAEAHLRDNDFPSAIAVLSVYPATVSEGDVVTTTITVTTNHDQQPHGGGGTLTLSSDEGTAQDADYGSLSQTVFPIAADDLSPVDIGNGEMRYRAEYTATIVIADDSESESDETIRIQLSKNADASQISIGTPATSTVTIAANDASTEAGLSALSLSVGNLNPAFATRFTTYTAAVAYEVEYITVTSTTSDSSAGIEFLDGNDSILSDADETPGLQVKLAVGENIIKVKVTAEDGHTARTYTVTVTRAKPEVGISSESAEVDEGTGITFTVSRGAAASDTLDVTVSVTETGALMPAVNEGSKTVTIPAGATSTALELSTDTDDDDWENHSEVTATIGTGTSSSYIIKAGEGIASTLVRDNDFPYAMALLSVNPNTVLEGETVNAKVTVRTVRDEMPHTDGGDMRITTGSDSATDGVDYFALATSTGTVNFVASDFLPVDENGHGRYEASKHVNIVTVADIDQEGVEKFFVILDKVAEGQSPTAGQIVLGRNKHDCSDNPRRPGVRTGHVSPELGDFDAGI